jgi:UDP-N-acetyl-D-galactosamine dehydrogenase
MDRWVAQLLDQAEGEWACRSLVLGLTFKENVPDLRNSKVVDLVAALAARGHQVTVHDPHADSAEATHEYGLTLDAAALDSTYDLVVLAVPHRTYLELGAEGLRGLLTADGILADLKGALDGDADWSL